MPEDDVISIITRGFAGMQEQFRERDKATQQLSEKMVGVELKLGQLKEMTEKIEQEVSRAENETLKLRVTNLEKANDDLKKRQDSNATWIRGLVAGVILLLIGVLFNFIMARLKQ